MCIDPCIDMWYRQVDMWHRHVVQTWFMGRDSAFKRVAVPNGPGVRLYIGIADGMSIARVWACRCSK